MVLLSRPEERLGILELWWEVVYVDGRVHDDGASLLRRVAGLPYVSDHESGAARLRVMERSGIARWSEWLAAGSM